MDTPHGGDTIATVPALHADSETPSDHLLHYTYTWFPYDWILCYLDLPIYVALSDSKDTAILRSLLSYLYTLIYTSNSYVDTL